jgi:hypothetical protein
VGPRAVLDAVVQGLLVLSLIGTKIKRIDGDLLECTIPKFAWSFNVSDSYVSLTILFLQSRLLNSTHWVQKVKVKYSCPCAFLSEHHAMKSYRVEV